MKIFRVYLLTLLTLTAVAGAFAFKDDPLDFMWEKAPEPQNDKPALETKLDPKRIINASNNFLKEREPEMTAEEYALYEKVVTSLSANPEFAVKLLEAMMNDKEPPSPAFEFILGNVYYSAGETDKAEARYLSAVKRFPTFVRGWTNLGILYYSKDKYEQAVPCFSKAVALGDHDPSTLGLLGYCLERTGNVVAAEMSYMQALAENPEATEWMEGLLRIYIQGKQYGRAESLVKVLIKQQPTKAELWLAHANILLAENRKLDAIILLEAASGAGLAGPDELNLLGDLYAEQGFYPEAAGVYQKIFATTPDLGERKLIYFAEVLISANHLPQAADVLVRLKNVTTPAGRHGYLQASAELAAARKQWPEARKDWQELLQNAPLDGRALLGLGRTYVEENDLSHAAFAYESAYQIPSSTYRASLELATIAIKNRQYDKCVEYLQKALSMEKTDGVADYLVRAKTLAGRNAE